MCSDSAFQGSLPPCGVQSRYTKKGAGSQYPLPHKCKAAPTVAGSGRSLRQHSRAGLHELEHLVACKEGGGLFRHGTLAPGLRSPWVVFRRSQSFHFLSIGQNLSFAQEPVAPALLAAQEVPLYRLAEVVSSVPSRFRRLSGCNPLGG